MVNIKTHRDLKVYQLAFETSMLIFELSKQFSGEEMYSLTDQIRRSSRSVSGNISEAFRKRRYPKSFVAKLSDAKGEAAETQVWLDYSLKCGYMKEDIYTEFDDKYDHIISMIINMISKPQNWQW